MSSDNPQKAKRKRVDIEIKKQICLESSSSVSNRELAKKYGVNESSLCKWLQQKDLILENPSLAKKNFIKSEFEELDKGLFLWFQEKRSERPPIPIDGPILLEQAKKFAVQFAQRFIVSNPKLAQAYSSFKASQGFLTRWKARHNVVFKSVCGESASINPEQTEHWFRESLPKFLKDYELCDIYNADQTGLFFRMTPDKTLAFKNEKCHGGKLSKERLTVMVGSNITGSDKIKLSIVGKAKKPRCFKNTEELPVTYRANKKAWWNKELTLEWIRTLNARKRKENRQVILFLDNFSGHKVDETYSNLNVVYLPPNSTSKTQPMDCGIIKNLKVNYRRRLLRRILTAIELKKFADFKVSIKDAVFMLDQAWKDVTTVTIENCFQRDKKTWDIMRSHFKLAIEESDYVDIDSSVCRSEPLSEAEILDLVCPENTPSQEDDNDNDDHDAPPEPPFIKSAAHAMEMVNHLRMFVYNQPGYSSDILKALDKLDEFSADSLLANRRQTVLTDFFAQRNLINSQEPELRLELEDSDCEHID